MSELHGHFRLDLCIILILNKSYDGFRSRHVSDELHPLSLQVTKPTSGCDINTKRTK